MTFSTYYDSNDTGLGGLANTAGSLITFLDKVLVNGYNSQTLTSLTSSGTVATATLNSHGFRDRQFVTIAGATPSGYNGTFQIITGSTTANTFQYNLAGSLSSPATGTITCIVAPLGWTKAFSGTNLAAYKQAGGNGLYLRLDDTGTISGRVVGYETMSDVNTGVNPFPTTLQFSGGAHFPKASAAGPRRVIFWGNASMFWLFTDYTGDSSSGALYGFGDGTSYKSGDVWFTNMIACNSATTFEGGQIYTPTASCYVAITGRFIARSYTGVAGSVTANAVADFRFSSLSPAGAVTMGGNVANSMPNYPTLVDGNMWTSQLTALEIAAATPRGQLVGAYAPLHSRPLTNYSIFTGAGALAGKELMAISYGTTGQVLAEISNTW